MGADIWMFVEHKDLDTNKWNLVKNTDWRNNMVPIYRNTGLFHILCGYYNKDGFDELSVIWLEQRSASILKLPGISLLKLSLIFVQLIVTIKMFGLYLD